MRIMHDVRPLRVIQLFEKKFKVLCVGASVTDEASVAKIFLGSKGRETMLQERASFREFHRSVSAVQLLLENRGTYR